MLPIRNTEFRYGVVAMLFHWAMALLILGVAILGLYMVTLPDAGFTTVKIRLIVAHKAFGTLVLVLVGPRLLWRLLQRLPRLVANVPAWQQVAARFVHLVFYALMFTVPLSGWLMSSAAGIPVLLWDDIVLPDLIPYNDHRFRQLMTLHQGLAYALLFFIAIHVGAALRHHLLLKDDTLRKMLP